jgi:acid phosphatase
MQAFHARSAVSSCDTMPPPFRCLLAAAFLLDGATAVSAVTLPHYDHVVVVIEENHAFAEILGADSPAPYLRFLAADGAALTQSFAIVHPSQPNYLALFSGSTQGVIDDSEPAGTPFSTPNLGAELRAKGLSFAGFSQSLPQLGYNGKSFTVRPGEHRYERKHNPWVNWQANSPGPNQLPPAVNLPFENTFPIRPDADFSVLPTVSFVIPDERFDMHDGSIADADEWLRANLSAYAAWAKDHNSLLIVTFDEDDGSQANQIATIFYGANLQPGRHREHSDHYGVLRTLEDLFGLDHAGAAASAAPVTSVFAHD